MGGGGGGGCMGGGSNKETEMEREREREREGVRHRNSGTVSRKRLETDRHGGEVTEGKGEE